MPCLSFLQAVHLHMTTAKVLQDHTRISKYALGMECDNIVMEFRSAHNHWVRSHPELLPSL